MSELAGTKTPLVLIPGLLCDALLWAHQIGALSDIADCWVPNPVAAASIRDLAATVLETSPFEKFALAGLSMGGYITLEIMRQAPSRVLKLALLDTSARPDAPEQTRRRHALVELVRGGKFTEVVRLLLPALVNRARSYDPEIVGTVWAMARNVGEEAFYRQEAAIIGRIDSRPHLRDIDCATLIICGRQDAITPPEVHEELSRGISGAKLAIIEDCGHLSTMEQPEEVSAALRSWLAN
jgi:pimeloyl-ACP methyl ester carboxylesterase